MARRTVRRLAAAVLAAPMLALAVPAAASAHSYDYYWYDGPYYGWYWGDGYWYGGSFYATSGSFAGPGGAASYHVFSFAH
ncbi:hypothetical protein [Nocardiopsis sp. FIRDI 009]|uniref:hypothetical protein n=1 Tax=Nocardiopsis sp. FIRDI 009 TaxID=714197 RepID=UPI000E241D1D|nr:hypothetical protein [Nocardiopsis sp. FIRDI 009]